MRLVTTPRETVPSTVAKFLLPGESNFIAVRKHPAILGGPILLVVGGLIVAGVLTEFIGQRNGTALLVIWLAWAGLVGYLVWEALEWWVNYFVVTPKRLLQTDGLITRRVAMMPLTKVTDMGFQRTFQGRLLGFGRFTVEAAGAEQVLRTVDYIPYPEQLYLEVCGLLFPDMTEQDED
jgi:uncharacterized membrane protein YdbT with pleckstrin-like domain